MRTLLLSIIYLATCVLTAQQTYTTALLPDEYWWGGLSADGRLMPYTHDSQLQRDQYANNAGNQAQPLLVSNQGRYIRSEQPLQYTFTGDSLRVAIRQGELIIGSEGESLSKVFAYVSDRFFPPTGELPDSLLFTRPQYNTWIELVYDQEQEAILEYARAIIDRGYPPGVLMIDDNWQEDYGDWRFSGTRFSDPKMMMDSLHTMGFKVMLWVCPFVSPDSDEYRYLADEGLLVLDSTRVTRSGEDRWTDTRNTAAMIRWWNGVSAVLDLSNPEAQQWFGDRLEALVKEYGVDGFKLDAGDAEFYQGPLLGRNVDIPNDQTTYFSEVGLRYPLNEYRASWKMAGQPLVQRLQDKNHNWADLRSLIPGILAQGLMGYAYTCPDMIGGGQYLSFLGDAEIDQELIVRSAQVHALMPMMQFSVAPWRVLAEGYERMCQQMAVLHEEYGPRIMEIAHAAAETGEPIARPLDYNYPGEGYGNIVDQFMLGRDLLVAPVVEKGQRSRKIIFPAGRWRGDDGSVVEGPTVQTIDVPLHRLPYYERLSGVE